MSNSPGLCTLSVVGIVLTSVIGLVSCSNQDDATQPSESVETSTTPMVSETSPTTTESPDPVPILDVYDDVEFYPACGNETLNHSGQMWYPIARVGFDPMDASLQETVDAVLGVEREESPVARMQGLVRVSPPEPGDDVGTMVVWADGVARWVSDNGDLDVWMIDREITYTWDC